MIEIHSYTDEKGFEKFSEDDILPDYVLKQLLPIINESYVTQIQMLQNSVMQLMKKAEYNEKFYQLELERKDFEERRHQEMIELNKSIGMTLDKLIFTIGNRS